MFKKFIAVALLLFSVNAIAQHATTYGETFSDNPVKQLTLAGLLVNYGYETQTALPLIQAVKIYQEFPVLPALDGLKPVVEGETIEGDTLIQCPLRTEEKLLDDAAQFAKGDVNLMALIEGCRKVNRKPSKTYFYHNDYIAPKKTHVWTVSLSGGKYSFVHLSGDGSSDLDLYLYDQQGKEFYKETNAGDQCGTMIDPGGSSAIIVKIVNLGHVVNSYKLTVY